MSASLSAAELEHYREHGYVFPRYRLPDDLLRRLRAATDGLLSTYTDVAQEDLANPHMIPPTTGPDLNPFMAAAQDPGVLDLVRAGARARSHPVDHARAVQAASRRARSAVAPGRRVLAHAPARDRFGVDRDRSGVAGERLHALHSRIASAAGALPASRERSQGPRAQSRARLRPVRREDGRQRRTRARPDVDPRRAPDPRFARQHFRPAARGADHALHARRLRTTTARSSRSARTTARSTSTTSRCG